jgi:hypothetical protein
MVLALVAFSASSVFAQGTFFWSTSDLNGGASNGAFAGDFNVGDSGSLFLYYSTDGDMANDIGVGGIDANLALDTAGVVNITGSEIFDVAILVGGAPIFRRWSVVPGGATAGNGAIQNGTVSGDGQSIDQMGSVNLFGQGILSANTGGGTFVDEGYDTGAQAFILGRIDFSVVGEGTTNLNFLDSTQVVDGPEDIGFVDAGAQFNVGNAVPEPTSAGLLALGLIGLVARRRR